jgi:hypothetical protein
LRNPSQKKAVRVAGGGVLEFKPQYHQKIKKKKFEEIVSDYIGLEAQVTIYRYCTVASEICGCFSQFRY